MTPTPRFPISSDSIRGHFRRVDRLLEQLPVSDSDELFSHIALLCYEHEKTAFSHGILMGLHFMSELNALP